MKNIIVSLLGTIGIGVLANEAMEEADRVKKRGWWLPVAGLVCLLSSILLAALW